MTSSLSLRYDVIIVDRNRAAKKRPLSISPVFSEQNFDLTSLIRNSPNYFVPFLNTSALRSSGGSVGSGGSYSRLLASTMRSEMILFYCYDN